MSRGHRRRRAVTPEELERGYYAALRREKRRELHYRETEQGAFELGMVHVDFEELESRDLDKVRSWLSDDGAALDRMIAEIDNDQETLLSAYNRKKRAAAKQLKRKMPETVPVFLLVCKYGKNRKESIRCLAVIIGRQATRNGESIPDEVTRTALAKAIYFGSSCMTVGIRSRHNLI